MRPQDLFIEAAKAVQPHEYYSVTSPESERLELAREALRQRVAGLLDAILPVLLANKISTDSENQAVYNLDIPEDGAYNWSGGFKAKPRVEPMGWLSVAVTKRWLRVEMPAEEEFGMLAPEGFYVAKIVAFGVHDLEFSTDGGENWTERSASRSIDCVTRLLIVPEIDVEDSDPVDSFYDPFYDGPIVLERTNHLYPVFTENPDDDVDIQMGVMPHDPHQYSSPFQLIEGLQSALDDIAKVAQVSLDIQA